VSLTGIPAVQNTAGFCRKSCLAHLLLRVVEVFWGCKIVCVKKEKNRR